MTYPPTPNAPGPGPAQRPEPIDAADLLAPLNRPVAELTAPRFSLADVAAVLCDPELRLHNTRRVAAMRRFLELTARA